jgi:hypothetical protein
MTFFFDTHDGSRAFADESGVVLPDENEAVEQAVSLLRDLSHAEVPVGMARVFSVRVRGGGGEALYEAVMQIKIDRLV